MKIRGLQLHQGKRTALPVGLVVSILEARNLSRGQRERLRARGVYIPYLGGGSKKGRVIGPHMQKRSTKPLKGTIDLWEAEGRFWREAKEASADLLARLQQYHEIPAHEQSMEKGSNVAARPRPAFPKDDCGLTS